MEIYRDNCLSLPEQVQKNKCDIKNLYGKLDLTKWKHETINLATENWMHVGSNIATYNIVNSNFIENMLFVVTPANEKASIAYGDINFAESYDGGIVITTRYKPDVDIEIVIYYNYNVVEEK